MQPTRNALSENIRAKSIGLLNRQLAAAIDLQGQVKQAHWNVRGPGFIAVHELFDRVSTDILGFADTIAERAAALGGTVEGTIQRAAAGTSLKPYPLAIATAEKHIAAVADALAAFAESGREAIDATAEFGDAVTSDLFTTVTREVDQLRWLVEAHQTPV